MDINEMQSLLQTKLKPQRYAHCIGVMNTAVELAKRFNVDEKKAALAGLLHDWQKRRSVICILLISTDSCRY